VPARSAEERAMDAEVFQDFVIELRLERDGSYVAEIAEIPGCMAAGDDPNEAVSLLRDSVTLWLGASH
jgi:predicted RNase H-like HicB family nuclease